MTKVKAAAGRIRAANRGMLAAALLAGAVGLSGAVWAPAQEISPADQVQALLDEAKDHGAKNRLPSAWWQLSQAYESARKDGAGDQEWRDLASAGRRLVNMALFVEEMRRQKSETEALLGRFDQALLEIAALNGLALPGELTGSALADALLDRLHAANLRRQVMVDSLTIANRHLSEMVGGRVAAQDSIITAQQVEISALRQKLWETELRAGVAEADRSAAESVLTSKQQREDTILQLRSSFTPKEGEILLTPEGEIMLRLQGISFAVGSAELKPGQDDLIDRLAGAIGRFPGAEVRVDGHTDDTGSRDANLRLSRRRAETVARLLEERIGMASGVIATEGFGPDRPVALNSTPEGRALNRRIDVIINPTP
ncbi:OmpA family protein [bacterium]|nr:OmpA family protein [bacterium]